MNNFSVKGKKFEVQRIEIADKREEWDNVFFQLISKDRQRLLTSSQYLP